MNKTQTPEAPAWLNLDAVAPWEYRAEAAAAIEEMRRLLKTAEPILERVYAVQNTRKSHFVSVRGNGSDINDVIDELSGFNTMFDLVEKLRTWCACSIDDEGGFGRHPNPTWPSWFTEFHDREVSEAVTP